MLVLLIFIIIVFVSHALSLLHCIVFSVRDFESSTMITSRTLCRLGTDYVCALLKRRGTACCAVPYCVCVRRRYLD